MKIRAAVLSEMNCARPYGESRPIRIEKLELKEPGHDEVLVQIKAAGLCHSDLSVINGDRPRPLPMVLGHEAAGEIKAIGTGITDLAVGDHVVSTFMPSCGSCGPCAEGRPALCEPGAAANSAGTMASGGYRLFRQDGAEVNHHLGVSGFADHAVISRGSLVKVDPALPFVHAALFGCAVLTGTGAACNAANVRPGQTVAVVGLGGVGLSSILGAIVAGAREVIAIDLREDKLRIAEQLGADRTYLASDSSTVEQLREATNGGVDVAMEMTGSEKALELAYEITHRGGLTVSAGLAAPDRRISISPLTLVAEERTLKGCYLGSCVPSRDVPRYIDLFKKGRLPVDKLLSRTLTLDEINDGFDDLADGKAVRQVIVFD